MNAFSPQQNGTPNLNSQAAAALSALQQFVPISLVNSSLSGFQSLDTNALAQFAAAAQSQALSSSTAQSLMGSGLGKLALLVLNHASTF